MNGEEIQSLLENAYGNCTLFDNGVCCVNVDGAQIYVNTNDLNQNSVELSGYMPGINGLQKNDNTIYNNMISDTPKSGIIATGESWSDNNNCMEIGMDIANLLGCNVDKAYVQGFSAGGGVAVQRGNEFSGNHPNIDLEVFLVDPYNIAPNQKYTTNVSNLVENDVPIFILGPSGLGHLNELNKRLVSNGLDTITLKTNATHGEIGRLGLRDFFIGQGVDLNNYSITIYNPETKKYEAISVEEYEEYKKSYIGNGLYQIKMSRSDVSALNNGTGSVVATNVLTVVNGINAIARELNNSEACINPSKVSMSSTAGIPGALYKCQDVYLGMSTNLITSLISELNVIQSMAQTYYDMDKSLSASASTLAGSGSTEVSTSSIDIKLNSIIDSRPNSKISFNSSFLYDLPSAVAGKVYKGEVESALNGGLDANFESERSSARATKTQIEHFASAIGSSLKGGAWNKVKINLENYSNLMDERIRSVNKLENAMKEALTLVLEYMEDYDVLDDSKLPEIRDTLEKIKEEIENANMVINKT
ncbi:MAG: hypothetical protein ACI33S_04900, partial [Bacilli bacterium]